MFTSLLVICCECIPYYIKLYKCLCDIKKCLMYRKMATIIPFETAIETEEPIINMAHEVLTAQVNIL